MFLNYFCSFFDNTNILLPGYIITHNYKESKEKQLIFDVEHFSGVFEYIKNPSEKVIESYINSPFLNNDTIHEVNLTGRQAYGLIMFNKQFNLLNYYEFNDEEYLSLLSKHKNTDIIKYLPNYFTMCAISLNPLNIQYLNQEIKYTSHKLGSIEYNINTSEYILRALDNDNINKVGKYINWDLFDETDDNWRDIICILIKTDDTECIPEFLTEKTVMYESLFNIDNCIIRRIPLEYQSDYMYEEILYTNNEQYYRYIEQTEEVLNRYKTASIQNIPEDRQEYEYILKNVTPKNLGFVRLDLITFDVLKYIFKQQIIPRKERFDFVKKYSHTRILAILKARPSVIEIFNVKTHDMIKTVLEVDGYILRKLTKEEQTKFLVKIALKTTPKAIKYVL